MLEWTLEFLKAHPTLLAKTLEFLLEHPKLLEKTIDTALDKVRAQTAKEVAAKEEQ